MLGQHNYISIPKENIERSITMFSKNSWGCKQFNAEFGITPNKSHMSSLIAAKWYTHYYGMETDYLLIAIEEIFDTLDKPVTAQQEFLEHLKALWGKYKTMMCVKEKAAFRYIVIELGLEFKHASGVGIKELQKQLFKLAVQVIRLDFEVIQKAA